MWTGCWISHSNCLKQSRFDEIKNNASKGPNKLPKSALVLEINMVIAADWSIDVFAIEITLAPSSLAICTKEALIFARLFFFYPFRAFSRTDEFDSRAKLAVCPFQDTKRLVSDPI